VGDRPAEGTVCPPATGRLGSLLAGETAASFKVLGSLSHRMSELGHESEGRSTGDIPSGTARPRIRFRPVTCKTEDSRIGVARTDADRSRMNTESNLFWSAP
jgi:hypothetical protein